MLPDGLISLAHLQQLCSAVADFSRLPYYFYAIMYCKVKVSDINSLQSCVEKYAS